mmetsp:Transcript_2947/g.5948  ORF Transcript_2947/g.5948 Transcript_2947/m.5948 type:complete len:242 (+) Transcript_2947:230-955(+)
MVWLRVSSSSTSAIMNRACSITRCLCIVSSLSRKQRNLRVPPDIFLAVLPLFFWLDLLVSAASGESSSLSSSSSSSSKIMRLLFFLPFSAAISSSFSTLLLVRRVERRTEDFGGEGDRIFFAGDGEGFFSVLTFLAIGTVSFATLLFLLVLFLGLFLLFDMAKNSWGEISTASSSSFFSVAFRFLVTASFCAFFFEVFESLSTLDDEDEAETEEEPPAGGFFLAAGFLPKKDRMSMLALLN